MGLALWEPRENTLALLYPLRPPCCFSSMSPQPLKLTSPTHPILIHKSSTLSPPRPLPGSTSSNAVCVGVALRRSGGYSFAGEWAPPPHGSSLSTPSLPPWALQAFVLTNHYFSRVDVAHLVLYHLSVCCKKKYFDFDREILPFTSENWDSLLLGEVRGIEALGVRVEQGRMEKGRRERDYFSPDPILLSQLSDTPKGERSSKLLSALNSHKDR